MCRETGVFVDTMEPRWWVVWKPEAIAWRDALVRKSEIARLQRRKGREYDPMEGVLIPGFGVMEVLHTGRYLVLQNVDFRIELATTKGSHPDVRMVARAMVLASEGWRHVLCKMRTWVTTAVGQVMKDSMARIDLTCDLVSGDPKKSWLDECIVSAAHRGHDFEEAPKDRWMDPREMPVRVESHMGRRTWTGFTIGAMTVLLRWYDKLRKLDNGAAQVRWDRVGLDLSGISERVRVWRLEFQLRNKNKWFDRILSFHDGTGEVFCYATLDDWERLGLSPMWQYLTQRWVRAVEPESASRLERCDSNSFWRRVQGACEESSFTFESRAPLSESRVNVRSQGRQGLGCLMNAVVGAGRGPEIAEELFQHPRMREYLKGVWKRKLHRSGSSRVFASVDELVAEIVEDRGGSDGGCGAAEFGGESVGVGAPEPESGGDVAGDDERTFDESLCGTSSDGTGGEEQEIAAETGASVDAPKAGEGLPQGGPVGSAVARRRAGGWGEPNRGGRWVENGASLEAALLAEGYPVFSSTLAAMDAGWQHVFGDQCEDPRACEVYMTGSRSYVKMLRPDT